MESLETMRERLLGDEDKAENEYVDERGKIDAEEGEDLRGEERGGEVLRSHVGGAIARILGPKQRHAPTALHAGHFKPTPDTSTHAPSSPAAHFPEPQTTSHNPPSSFSKLCHHIFKFHPLWYPGTRPQIYLNKHRTCTAMIIPRPSRPPHQ